MKVKFNKFERAAGLFVLAAIVGGIVTMIGVAVQQGWFEAKVRLMTNLKNADGIRPGTIVQMAGLRAGHVTAVDLQSSDDIRVVFEISEKYHSLVREDSVVRTIRPFIISEKVLDISIGDKSLPIVADGGTIRAEDTADLMDLVSGRLLAPHLDSVTKMFESVHMIAEALLNPERSQDFIRMFDELTPLAKNMNELSREAIVLLRGPGKKKKGLIQVVQNLQVTTHELNRMLPEINKIVPHLAADGGKVAGDLTKIAANLAVLTDEIQSTLPALKAMLEELGPDLPKTTRRAMEALDETVVTLKALQKSFLLRSSAREVREEEAERERTRIPAADKE